MDWDAFRQSWRDTPGVAWQIVVTGAVTLAVYALALDGQSVIAGRAVPPIVLAFVVFGCVKLVASLLFLNLSRWDITSRWISATLAIPPVVGLLVVAILWADAQTVMFGFAWLSGGYGGCFLLFLLCAKVDVHMLPALGAGWTEWGDVAAIWQGLMNVLFGMALTVMAFMDAQDVYVVAATVCLPVPHNLKNFAFVMMIRAHHDTQG